MNHSFNRQHSSALACDASEADVMGQGPHTDIQPKYGFCRFSAVFNLSNFLCYLGYMVNSCQNTKRMMEFEEKHFKNFQQQLKETKSGSQQDSDCISGWQFCGFIVLCMACIRWTECGPPIQGNAIGIRRDTTTSGCGV